MQKPITRRKLLALSYVAGGAAVLSACQPVARLVEIVAPPTATPVPPTATPVPPTATPVPPTATPVPELTTVAIAELLRPSTVRISAYLSPVEGMQERVVSGTGTVVGFQKQLFIVTNHHVVAGATRITFSLAGSAGERQVTLAGDVPRNDLAVLAVDDTAGLAPVDLGRSRDLAAGQEVVAVGYPLGLGVEPSNAEGTVSRLVPVGNFPSLVQHNAAIDPGYSGGPLVDRRGRFIGVNTLALGQGVKFAIPSDDVMALLGDLAGGERRDWLGLKLAPYQADDRTAGLLVESVEPGSPAAVAGLMVADLLVVVNERTVTSGDELYAALGDASVGDTVFVGVVRLGVEPPQALAGVLSVGDPRGVNVLEPLGHARPQELSPAELAAWRGEVRVFRDQQLARVLFDTFDTHDSFLSWPQGPGAALRNDRYELLVGAGSMQAYFRTRRGNPQVLGGTAFVELRVAFASFEGTSGVGIAFDGQDPANYSAFVIRRDNTYQLVTVVGGAVDPLYSTDPIPTATINGDQPNRLRVLRHNGRVDLAVNDTLVCTLDKSPFAGGQVGVAALGGGDIVNPQLVLADDLLIELPR